MSKKGKCTGGMSRRTLLKLVGAGGIGVGIGIDPFDLIDKAGFPLARGVLAAAPGETVVAVVKDPEIADTDQAAYRVDHAPFNPPTIYPEYPHASTATDSGNRVYPMVREALRLLSPEGFGAKNWNPLGSVIDSAHKKVLVKPNLVQAHYRDACHGSVIRAVLDYVWIALKAAGGGTIRVGDAVDGDDPVEEVAELNGLDKVLSALSGWGVPVNGTVRDMNDDRRTGIRLGDASEYSQSSVSPPPARCRWITHKADTWDGIYDVAESLLWCDVLINLPKIKTHCSAGATLAMKNLMGCLTPGKHMYRDVPHNRYAPNDNKNDPPNNDSIWRGIVDISKIALYYNGSLQGSRQRRHFALVDGIIGTQGKGPHGVWGAKPFASKCVVAGYEPVSVDALCARVMGMMWDKLQTTNFGSQVSHALGPAHPSKIQVRMPEGRNISGDFAKGYELYPGSRSQEVQGLKDFAPPAVTATAVGRVVTAEVADADNDIGRVELHAQVGTAVQVIVMTQSSGSGKSGTFTASLPASTVKYRVMAMDKYFNDKWTEWRSLSP